MATWVCMAWDMFPANQKGVTVTEGKARKMQGWGWERERKGEGGGEGERRDEKRRFENCLFPKVFRTQNIHGLQRLPSLGSCQKLVSSKCFRT